MNSIRERLEFESTYCKFAHFYELVKFIIGPKVLFIAPFRFLRSNIFFGFVW